MLNFKYFSNLSVVYRWFDNAYIITIMLKLSEILIAYPDEVDDFSTLEAKITQLAHSSGERFFKIDVKPQFNDTPKNWEDRLEAAFY